MKKILLNSVPPVLENTPSPALSVLKNYLEANGYYVDIKYWNLFLYDQLRAFFNFQDLVLKDNLMKLLPFFSYIAIQKSDQSVFKIICNEILQHKPYLIQQDEGYIESNILSAVNALIYTIDCELKTINFDEYLYIGFSSLFYQWIPANVIKERIDKIHSNVNYVIGGFGTYNEANAFLNNFPGWRYALWGEGEIPLLKFTKYVENNFQVSYRYDIPNLCFCEDNQIMRTQVRNQYPDLSSLSFNISDYMSLINDSKSTITRGAIILPLERSRGCHWNKCRFCFLNSGYRYRIKSDDQIIKEMNYYLEVYGINNFIFLDNDLIGENTVGFSIFLDKLIELRKTREFYFYLSEIETKNIDRNLIRKLKLAGFVNIQFGYESPSNQLLNKINKKNTFASNVLLIKWCIILGLNIINPHIIRNLLEETTDDVKEGVWNLYYLRFLLDDKLFKHHYANLAISSASPYYKEILKSGDSEKYNYSKVMSLLPSNYVKNRDRFHLFLDTVYNENNKMWNVFKKVEAFYLKNKHSYILVKQDMGILFIEYINGLEAQKVVLDDMLFSILSACNEKVVSIEEVTTSLNNEKITKDRVIKAITKLREAGLLYSNHELSEIVSIVNTDVVI